MTLEFVPLGNYKPASQMLGVQEAKVKPVTSLTLATLAFGLAACAQPDKSQVVAGPLPTVTVAQIVAEANAGNDKAALALAGADIRAGNMAAAFHWLKLSADRGAPLGEAGVGLFYAHGMGVPQDYSLALKYDRLSAAQNNAAGLNNLGVLYQQGLGVPANPVKAAQLYRRAAMLGNGAAQASFARCLAGGIGTGKDLRQAYFWYSLAAARLNGPPLAGLMAQRDALARQLPAAAVTQLQSAAAIWQPGTEPPTPSTHRTMHTMQPGTLDHGSVHTSL